MKKLMLVGMMMMLAVNGYARSLEKPNLPEFSAFAKGQTLYVTLLGDCNNYGGSLEVAGLCHADRVTKNMAYECEAELVVYSTKMACPMHKTLEPKVLEIDMSEARVASEARILRLTYGKAKIDVRLKK